MGDGNNNMSSNGTKASTSQVCKIPSAYYDPVDFKDKNENKKELTLGTEITNDTNIITMYQKFNGFFGYGRWSKSNVIRYHQGYDYCAKNGETEVKAVHHGQVTRIRFGHPTGDCFLKNYFMQKKSFSIKFNQEDIEKAKLKYCNSCEKNSDCYGLQVYLQVSDTLYAHYAHLSKLNNKIFYGSFSFDKDKPNDFIPQTRIEVCGDEILGNSGDTGNASTVPVKHLHFECREGSEDGTLISPNKIVKTEFKIKNKNDESKPLLEEIEKDNIIEYSIRKQIADEWYNVESEKQRNSFIKEQWIKSGYPEEEYPQGKMKQQKKDPRWNSIYVNSWEGEDGKSGMRTEKWKKYEEKRIKEEREKKEKRINNKIEEKIKNELKNILKKDNDIRSYIDADGWKIGIQKKKKEFEEKGRKWNTNTAFKEYNDEVIDELYEDIANNRDNEYIKDFQSIKNKYLEKFKAKSEEEIRKEDWKRVIKEKGALDQFREDHILIVANIKECKDNTKPAS